MKTLEQSYYSTQSGIRSSGRRIIGYDFARALAILGMIVVNFKVIMEADRAGAEWLVWLVGLLEGRAVAVFVVLAGVGLSLMSRRARLEHNPEKLIQQRNTLLKRALFLFIAGLLFNQVWPPDILHFYGLYIAIGAFLLTASDKRLWHMAAIFTFIFTILLFTLDYDAGWDWENLEYIGIWTPAGMVRHLFYNGFHPVFPWSAFLFVGMWLGRQNLSDRGFRKKLLKYSLAIVVATNSVSWLLIHLFSKFAANEIEREAIALIFGTSPIPPMPFYILSAGGMACIVITLSIMLTERFAAAWWVKPFVVTGQIALTLYVAHIIFGMGVLEEMGMLYNQSLTFAVVTSCIFYAASIVFALIWKRRFKLGPLEWVMRRMT